MMKVTTKVPTEQLQKNSVSAQLEEPDTSFVLSVLSLEEGVSPTSPASPAALPPSTSVGKGGRRLNLLRFRHRLPPIKRLKEPLGLNYYLELNNVHKVNEADQQRCYLPFRTCPGLLLKLAVYDGGIVTFTLHFMSQLTYHNIKQDDRHSHEDTRK